jgi:RNA polymerase sigma-70 factor (ECF subfamily)
MHTGENPHMIFVQSVRRVRFPSAGLQLAMAGPRTIARTANMSLLSGTVQPQPTRESQVMDLYDQLRPSLLTYLAGLGLNLNESEDVIHDCFVRLYDHLAVKAENHNLRGWLFRVAHNLAMDFFRDARRVQQQDEQGVDLLDLVIDPSCSPEELAIRSDEIRKVASALERLTPQQRSAVLLRAEDLRYREIAAVLGVSIKRVSELVQRALVILAGNL